MRAHRRTQVHPVVLMLLITLVVMFGFCRERPTFAQEQPKFAAVRFNAFGVPLFCYPTHSGDHRIQDGVLFLDNGVRIASDWMVGPMELLGVTPEKCKGGRV